MFECDLVLWKYFCTGTDGYRGHASCTGTDWYRGHASCTGTDWYSGHTSCTGTNWYRGHASCSGTGWYRGHTFLERKRKGESYREGKADGQRGRDIRQRVRYERERESKRER